MGLFDNLFKAAESDDLLKTLRERVEAGEMKVAEAVLNINASVQRQPWVDKPEINDSATEDAKQLATFFMLGMSRKLGAASPTLMASLATAGVLTDPENLKMLDTLFVVAYCRGIIKALELTKATYEPEDKAGDKETPKTEMDDLAARLASVCGG